MLLCHPRLPEAAPQTPAGTADRLRAGVAGLLPTPSTQCQVLVHVLGGHESLAAETTLILRLHHVDLRLHVAVEVRLSHALVVTQLAVEFANTWDNGKITNIT